MVPVTHLKLLLFAGGSFSQAPCRACSLLSWSWMLQNGTQNTGCLNVKMYEIQKSSVIPSGYRLGGLDPVVVQLVRHQRLWQLPQVWLQRTWSRGDKAQVLKCTHLLKSWHNLQRCIHELDCYDVHHPLTALISIITNHHLPHTQTY